MDQNVEAEHHGDQLVVERSHRPAVETMLRRLGVRQKGIDDTTPAPDDGTKPMVAESDDRLGLVRIGDLVDSVGNRIEVEELLGRLRQDAAAERDGWMPTIGKNRFVDAVIGEGTKTMGTKTMALSQLLSIMGTKTMGGAEPSIAVGIDFRPLGTPTPTTGSGVRIGIVDTPGDPAPSTGPAPVKSGHGMFVRSLIEREAPAAEIVVRGPLASETGRGDSWDVAKAIMDLVEQRVDVLNLSLGCFTLSGGPPMVLATALERVPESTLIVAAAGNHGATPALQWGRTSRSGCWPAALPQAVAVGGHNDVDDFGLPPWTPKLPWVSCTAPGRDVVGKYLTGPVQLADGPVEFGGFARWSGTSFAAASVTGLVAAVASAMPSTSAREALALLLRQGTLVRGFTPGA